MRATIMAGTMLLALTACNQGADTNQAAAAPPAPGGLASPDGRSEVRTDAGFSGLPEGIPAYPRINPGGAIQMGGREEGAEMRIMAFRTMDAPADVIAFYAEAGERAGFRVVNRAEVGPSRVLGLARDNGDALNVTATGTPTGTSVQLIAGHESR